MERDKLIELAKLLGCYVYCYDKDVAENCFYMLVGPTGFNDPLTGPERKTEAEAWADAEKILTGDGMLAVKVRLVEMGSTVTSAVYQQDGEIINIATITRNVDWCQRKADTEPEAVLEAALAVLRGGRK